jgi:PPE-repeat protein
MGAGASAGSGAKKKTPQPDSSAAAATAATAGRQRARAWRRRRVAAKDRGHADEFMNMNVDVDPDWEAPNEQPGTAASNQGAGPLGLPGTVRNGAVADATGLTTLSGDDFGGGPAMPMVPGTWAARR